MEIRYGSDRHFRDLNEIERLVDYLNHGRDLASLTLEEFDKQHKYFLRRFYRIKPNSAEGLKLKFKKEHERAEAMNYEKNSSFGNDSVKIAKNASEHLIKCPKCFESYKTVLREIADIWYDRFSNNHMEFVFKREDFIDFYIIKLDRNMLQVIPGSESPEDED